eukprot:Amastigsp_a677642_17.p3 type:complete len:282 gc:universal Amastigsp_a677642_17:337-1182(+)
MVDRRLEDSLWATAPFHCVLRASSHGRLLSRHVACVHDGAAAPYDLVRGDVSCVTAAHPNLPVAVPSAWHRAHARLDGAQQAVRAHADVLPSWRCHCHLHSDDDSSLHKRDPHRVLLVRRWRRSAGGCAHDPPRGACARAPRLCAARDVASHPRSHSGAVEPPLCDSARVDHVPELPAILRRAPCVLVPVQPQLGRPLAGDYSHGVDAWLVYVHAAVGVGCNTHRQKDGVSAGDGGRHGDFHLCAVRSRERQAGCLHCRVSVRLVVHQPQCKQRHVQLDPR